MQSYLDLVVRPLQLDVETFTWRTYSAPREPMVSRLDQADVEEDSRQFSLPPSELYASIVDWLSGNLSRLVGHDGAQLVATAHAVCLAVG